MSISNDITVMVDRLKRANIPMQDLCYELNEAEWQELIAYLQEFSRYQGKDLSYAEDIHFMGLHVRKRLTG